MAGSSTPLHPVLGLSSLPPASPMHHYGRYVPAWNPHAVFHMYVKYPPPHLPPSPPFLSILPVQQKPQLQLFSPCNRKVVSVMAV